MRIQNDSDICSIRFFRDATKLLLTFFHPIAGEKFTLSVSFRRRMTRLCASSLAPKMEQ